MAIEKKVAVKVLYQEITFFRICAYSIRFYHKWDSQE